MTHQKFMNNQSMLESMGNLYPSQNRVPHPSIQHMLKHLAHAYISLAEDTLRSGEQEDFHHYITHAEAIVKGL